MPPRPQPRFGAGRRQQCASKPEFAKAINYVTKIQTCFIKQPEKYRAFLEIVSHVFDDYVKKQRMPKQVCEQVHALLTDHTNLLAGFCEFLPIGVWQGPVSKECHAPSVNRPQMASSSWASARGRRGSRRRGTISPWMWASLPRSK